jgi:dCTP deaminase
MTDEQIERAVTAGALVIDPFDSETLQPASYDFRLGAKAIVARSVSVIDRLVGGRDRPPPEIDVKAVGEIQIPPDGFALIVTLERVGLSPRYVARIGFQSYYARKGLLLLSGPQVDPGFEGHLLLGLANASPGWLTIPYADAIATLEFHELASDCRRPYRGQYQGTQLGPIIPRSDAAFLRTYVTTRPVADLKWALLPLLALPIAIGVASLVLGALLIKLLGLLF